MALPESLTYVTVVGQVAAVPDGAARTVVFRTPRWLQGSPFIATFGLAATVAVDGTFAIELPATDDPAWSPINWTYDVTIQVGAQILTGTLAVPAATVGSIELSTALATGEPSDAGDVTYLLTSARGVAGGVAPLDGDGDVTDAAGNKITGGGGGGGGTPSGTVVSGTTYGQSASAGAATAYSRGDHTHGTPAAPTYAQVTGKPSTFAPSAHAASHADGGSDEISIDGSQVTTGSVPFARLPTGTSSSQVAIGNHTHGGGGGGVTPTFARDRVTTGDITPTTQASMAPLVGGPTISIAAVAGDNLEVALDCLIDRGPGSTDFYDLAVLSGSTVVRFSSTGTSSPPGSDEGDPSLYPGARFQGIGGHWSFSAVSGDIVGGNVTIGLCHKGGGAGKVYASSTFPFRWSIGNFKQ